MIEPSHHASFPRVRLSFCDRVGVAFTRLNAGFFVCRERAARNLEQFNVFQRPQDRTITSKIGFFRNDVESEGTLCHVAALYTCVNVHRITIFRIDFDATPQSARVDLQFQGAVRCSTDDKCRVMVDQCADISGKRRIKRVRRDLFKRTVPQFRFCIKYGEISFDDRISVVVPRFEVLGRREEIPLVCFRSQIDDIFVHCSTSY